MSFAELVDSLDCPMVVVTTAVQTVRAGCLVGFHSRCSVEPARYAVWLSKANHTFRIGALAELFAVHFLRASDYELARMFGTPGRRDRRAFRCSTPAPTGS